MKADILQYYYALLLRHVVRKTKYYTLPCYMVQVPEGAVTAVSVPTLQPSRVIFPSFDLKSTASVHQRKPFLTLISRQMMWQKLPPKGMGKKEIVFFKFLPVPFHSAFSLSPCHI